MHATGNGGAGRRPQLPAASGTTGLGQAARHLGPPPLRRRGRRRHRLRRVGQAQQRLAFGAALVGDAAAQSGVGRHTHAPRRATPTGALVGGRQWSWVRLLGAVVRPRRSPAARHVRGRLRRPRQARALNVEGDAGRREDAGAHRRGRGVGRAGAGWRVATPHRLRVGGQVHRKEAGQGAQAAQGCRSGSCTGRPVGCGGGAGVGQWQCHDAAGMRQWVAIRWAWGLRS